MAGAYDLIDSIQGSASSYTFSSIPDTYTHLEIHMASWINTSTSPAYVSMQLNDDTSSNYTWLGCMKGASSSGGDTNLHDNSHTSMELGYINNNNGSLDKRVMRIPHYNSDSFAKQVLYWYITGDGGSSSKGSAGFGTAAWYTLNTDVTKIKVYCALASSTSFGAQTRISLFGVGT
jgi:hypothetical protein|tara:strand:- start:17 stop:544 length:528 start_codon:yes stop_codon:yes gene_type:complete